MPSVGQQLLLRPDLARSAIPWGRAARQMGACSARSAQTFQPDRGCDYAPQLRHREGMSRFEHCAVR